MGSSLPLPNTDFHPNCAISNLSCDSIHLVGQALDEIGFDDELPCDCTVSDLSQIFAMKKGKRHAAATMKRILELSLVAGIFGWFKKHKQEGKKLVKSGSAVAQESKRRATDAQTNISNVS